MNKRTFFHFVVGLLGVAGWVHGESQAFKIDAEFPGGNVVVDSIEGNTVKFSPDVSGHLQPWFYWNFAVRGAAGQTLQFVRSPQGIGVHGPGVSVDGGKTWRWMGAGAVKDGAFSYVFPEGADDVRFSVGMPYVDANFQRFLDAHKGNPNLRTEVLTKTPKGRDVRLALIGSPGGNPRYAVAITCRHHASEMMASYVVEGILEGALAEDATGRWLRENVGFFVVPFMDTDGVEDGDQGKNRAPHDHNRDYAGDPIYAEVAALKARLPAWAAGRPLIFLDLHDPALKGDVHESLVFLEPSERDQAERLSRLTGILERDMQGTILLSRQNILKFGVGYNNLPSEGVSAPYSAGWARSLPNILFGLSVELPYANSGGCEVNADSAREFGRDLAAGLKTFLSEAPEKPL